MDIHGLLLNYERTVYTEWGFVKLTISNSCKEGIQDLWRSNNATIKFIKSN